MKLIDHLLLVDLDNGNKLMVNSLHGHIDEIESGTYEIIKQWQPLEEIEDHVHTEEETKLYDFLENRGYLVYDEEEEARIKDALLNLLRFAHLRDRQQRKVLTFVMTYECNFICAYCHDDRKAAMTQVMTTEQIDAALQLTDEHLEYIDFFGGEPLLPKTKELMAYIFAKKPNVQFGIATNGYYLSEFVPLLKQANIYRVTVTLDGMPEMHDSRRTLADGNPTFQKIVDGIEKCLQNNIPIRIRMNIDPALIGEAEKLEQFFQKHVQKYGHLLSFEKTTKKFLPHEQSNQVAADIYRSAINETPEERLHKYELLSSFNPIINAITVNIPIRPLYTYCYAHENKLVVDPYGRMYTCLVTLGEEDASIGTYYPELHFKTNSVYNRNIDRIAACCSCIYSLLCGGGCPMRLPNRTDVMQPMCDAIKSQIHDLLPKLYEVEKAKYKPNPER